MSENCFHNNPLRRDGTSQQQRTLHTLLPSYVAVDERSMKDLLYFVQNFAAEIKYYNSENSSWDSVNSKHFDWTPFFEITEADWATFSLEAYLAQLRIDQFARPHEALFFGFLYMFKVVQADINTITQKHLEFYYKEVLQLKEKPAEPDKVSIIFELAKHVDSHLLKAGTSLKAGKDTTGTDVIYKLNEDTVINKAEVVEIKAQFANIFDEWDGKAKYPKTDHRIYSSPIANSADGLGEEIETKEGDWRVFGRPSFITDEDNPSGLKVADRPEGHLGFAIASPILFLAEGQRRITLEIGIDANGPDLDYSKLDLQSFKLLLSGEEEWLLATVETVRESRPNSGKLLIEGQLKVDQAAVVAYDDTVFGENFDTQWPLLKVLIHTADLSSNSPYKGLKGILVETVKITVQIEEEGETPGIQNIIVQNDLGKLDPTKSMAIFGSIPHLGSKFYIGSKEVFQKKLEQLALKFQWVDLPQNSQGFSSYYKHYHVEGTSDNRSNTAFKTKIEVLNKKEWEVIANDQQLFTTTNGLDISTSTKLPDSETKSKISNMSPGLLSIDRKVNSKDFEEYDPNLAKGFMRLTLKGMDFGHRDFQNAYTYHAIHMANGTSTSNNTLLLKSLPPNKNVKDSVESKIIQNTDEWTLPNTPYVPTIESLSLYYKSSVTINLNSTVTATEETEIAENFFHLMPFGNYEVNRENPSNSLFPMITEEGNLYIGIEKLHPPQTLSLLIQVAEGSANPEKEKQTVQWSYLTKEGWKDFDQYTILSDGTNGLLTSGILKLDIPRAIATGNSRLSPKLYWIKAGVEKDTDAVCDIIAVRAQALSASFYDRGNDPRFLEKALEAGTIAKLKDADAAIKKLEQPYASSDGKPPERERAFYTRVSERLRHKNRAITIWDYEHLILEKFPLVYKVKCINHTRFDGTITNFSEIAPGHISLVIIANVQNKNAIDPLRPKASLDQLSQIASFIEALKPPCANLHVKNPIYEEIKVAFNVRLHQGKDVGFHLAKLQQEIKNFLSPWASDCSKDIVFGGRIHKSVILNFVEERSYVDYITCFKMYHIIKEDPENNPNKDVDEAIALTSVSIIGSADSHTILEIPSDGADQCLCDDNIILSTNELTVRDKC